MENALTAIARLLYAFNGRVARGFAESSKGLTFALETP
jgi:hypothetical protein